MLCSYTWLNVLFQTSDELSFNNMGLQGTKRKKKKNPLYSACILFLTRGDRERNVRFVSVRSLTFWLVSPLVFLDQSRLVGRAEANVDMFSGKEINIKNLRLR